MSTHYHAAQAKGFAFSDYEIQVEQWHRTFSGFDPSSLCTLLGLTADETHLYLTYLNREYRLCLKDGILEKKSFDGFWDSGLFFNEAMSIYHHLHYTSPSPRPKAGVWVPSADLEGLSTRNSRMGDPLLDPFSLAFTGKADLLEAACRALGGTKIGRGDVSYQFDTFPQIPLQVIFYDADEDFPAQTQVLADKNAVDYMHRETIGCIVADLLYLLEQEAMKLDGRLFDLRPHHGMCMAYFQGKGYSEDFTAHMTETLAAFAAEDPLVRLTVRSDHLCSHCPFEREGICKSQQKVAAYDRKVLEICRLPEGSILPVSRFRDLVNTRILKAGLRETICGNCSWTAICR